MHRNIKILVIGSMFLVMISAFGMARAVDDSTTTNETSQSNTAQIEEPLEIESLHCPDPTALQKEGSWWKVDDIWKSDTQSAGKKIKEFIGAQWMGIRVGKIICLYNEEEKYAFSVAMITVQPVLIMEPMASVWVANEKGHKSCISHNVLNCSFVQQKAARDIDLYEQIKYKNPGVR
jgi:hypothetical protein